MADTIKVVDKNVGLKPSVTWGVGVEPGVGNRIPTSSFTPPAGGRDMYADAEESGSGGIATCVTPLDFLEQTATIVQKLRAEGGMLARMYQCAFGGYAGTEVEPGVNAHTFTYVPSLSESDIDKLQNSLCWDGATAVKSMPSAMVDSLELSLDAGFMVSTSFKGDRVSISNYTHPLGVTSDSICSPLFRMKHLKVRINDQSDIALTDGDEYKVSNFGYTVTRGLNTLSNESGTEYPSRPVETDVSTFDITLSFTKETTQNSSFFSNFLSVGYKKMDLNFVYDTVIPTKSVPFSKKLSIPSAYIPEAPDYSWDTPSPVSITFRVKRAAIAPAGMTSTVPVLEWVNTETILT